MRLLLLLATGVTHCYAAAQGTTGHPSAMNSTSVPGTTTSGSDLQNTIASSSNSMIASSSTTEHSKLHGSLLSSQDHTSESGQRSSIRSSSQRSESRTSSHPQSSTINNTKHTINATGNASASSLIPKSPVSATATTLSRSSSSGTDTTAEGQPTAETRSNAQNSRPGLFHDSSATIASTGSHSPAETISVSNSTTEDTSPETSVATTAAPSLAQINASSSLSESLLVSNVSATDSSTLRATSSSIFSNSNDVGDNSTQVTTGLGEDISSSPISVSTNESTPLNTTVAQISHDTTISSASSEEAASISSTKTASNMTTPRPANSLSTSGPVSTTTEDPLTLITTSPENPTVISTITTVPPGVSFETLASMASNTWITTSKDGHSSTVVPVVGGIVIWNLPHWPSIAFDFPKLPTFHLPCIFKCNPKSDDEGDDEDEPEDKSSSSRTTSSATSQTSSTSSCSASEPTVSDCRVGCSLSYSTVSRSISTSTVCYTTSCETIVDSGCEPHRATTSTSISTSPASDAACPLMTVKQYDAVASYKAMGMAIPAWMEYIPMITGSPPEPSFSSLIPSSSLSDSASSDSTGSSTSTHDSGTTSSTSRSPSSSSTSDASSTGESLESSTSTDTDASTSTEKTQSTSVSSTTSDTATEASSSSAPSFTVPVALHPTPICHSEQNFVGHAPIDATEVTVGADVFCQSPETGTSMDELSSALRWTHRASDNVNYLYEIQWLEGCGPISVAQLPRTPMGLAASSCEQLLTGAYTGCDNGGVGGYQDSGCLRYTFTGGLGDDQVPEPSE